MTSWRAGPRERGASRGPVSSGAIIPPVVRLRLYRDRIALFTGPVVRPQETCRHAAPRPPRLRKHDDFFRGRPLRQPKSQPRAFLKGKIAGWPGIRMSKAKQEVDIGRPRADAVDGAERPVRIIGSHLRQG